MPLESDSGPPRRLIPSLASLCQRVAANHVDSISTLGNLPFNLVAPILERCSVETLIRLEQTSPHLQQDTLILWRDACFRTYPTLPGRYEAGDLEEPLSWRDEYFILQEAESKRLEQLAQRLRTQRHEEDQRKKDREIKVTDRLPPLKRARTAWGMPVQPKSLLQKTRSEASRIQKNIFNARMAPPMNKEYPLVLKSTVPPLLPSPQACLPSRVTVNTVVHKRKLPTTSIASSSSSASSSTSNPLSSSDTSSAPSPDSDTSSSVVKVAKLSIHSSPAKPTSCSSDIRTSLDPRPLKTPSCKKDPMAALFLPKHRAHSQLARRAVPLQ